MNSRNVRLLQGMMIRFMKTSDSLIEGFGPVAGPNARCLILGTIPGVQSLEAGQYYAHPRNAFWPIIETLLSDRRNLDYAARKTLLMQSGIALWDVLKTARRPGSLDSSIVPASAVANDFPAFFTSHPSITSVFFNGDNARKLFRKHVQPLLRIDLELHYARLPSTSPANARMTPAQKCAAWKVIRRFSSV